MLAEMLGKKEDAEQARHWARRAIQAARKLLWNEEDKLLYYHDGTSQLKMRGVYNLVGAPLLERREAAAMLERYVTPGSPFWPGIFGATATSDDPGYDPNQYWRGPVWGGPVWLCAEMFALAGFPDIARKAARPFLDAVASQPAFFEHYHPETGKGQRVPMLLGLTASTFALLAMQDYATASAYEDLRADGITG
jgi:glycogen debranching enzyme